MRRREFLGTIGGLVAAAACVALPNQDTKTRVVELFSLVGDTWWVTRFDDRGRVTQYFPSVFYKSPFFVPGESPTWIAYTNRGTFKSAIPQEIWNE